MSNDARASGSVARGFAGIDEFPWPLRRSGEVLELRYGKALVESSRRHGSVPVYGTNGQTGVHDAALFTGPGVIVGRKGAGHLGVHWSQENFWVIDTAYALIPTPAVDLKFAYYLVSQVGLDHLKYGTSNPSLTREVFGAQYFPIPPLQTQRAIAEVLRALDDKLAANSKLASTAIALADSIFTRDSRDLELGSATFADLALIQGGGTPSTKVDDYWGGHINWATPTDVTALESPYLESTSRLITDAGLAACSSALHPAGSIFMTSRATIGAFAISQAPTAVNQGFIVVNAHDAEAQWWLFHEMRSRVPEFLSHANGATFLELSRGKFKQFRVRLPVASAVKHFFDEVDPLHARARAAATESARLAATRDALLPLLMSGKIRVKDAESVVEGVV